MDWVVILPLCVEDGRPVEGCVPMPLSSSSSPSSSASPVSVGASGARVLDRRMELCG
jgi:hypothetical protein